MTMRRLGSPRAAARGCFGSSSAPWTQRCSGRHRLGNRRPVEL